MFDNSDDYEIIQKYVPLKDLPAFALFKLDKTKRSEEFVSVYVQLILFRKFQPRVKFSSSGLQLISASF